MRWLQRLGQVSNKAHVLAGGGIATLLTSQKLNWVRNVMELSESNTLLVSLRLSNFHRMGCHQFSHYVYI
jgi:hypothetical protein